MKSYIKIVCFFLLLGSVILSWVPANAQQQLTISESKGGTISILAHKVLNEAYSRLNIDVTFEGYPTERALRTSNSGAVDGETFRVANIDKQYPNLVMIPVPIGEIIFSAFSKKELNINGFSGLENYKIGLVIGAKLLEARTKGMNPDKVHETEQLFDMMELNRMDAALTTYTTGKKIIIDKQLTGYHIYNLIRIDIFHYLHKKNASLVPKLTAVLEEMQSEGFIKKAIDEFYRSQ